MQITNSDLISSVMSDLSRSFYWTWRLQNILQLHFF